MEQYEPPTVTEIGSLDEVTLSKIHKTGTSGDVIVLASGTTEQAPGSTFVSSS